MFPEEEKILRLWIRRYMKATKNINHMYNSTGIRLMMENDTHIPCDDKLFKQLVRSEGIEPVNWLADEWEFRISSVPFRRRAGTKVSGWLARENKYRTKRLR